MHEYLQSLADYLQSGQESHGHIRLLKKTESQSLWAAPTARIAQGARIVGTVLVQDDAEISTDTLVVGPTCIGRNVSISKDAVIIRSVLWDDAKVGPNCQIQQSLLDRGATVPANSIVRETAVAPMPPISTAPLSADRTHGKGQAVPTNSKFQLKLDKIIRKPLSCLRSQKRNILPFFAAGLVLLAFFWSYRQGLVELWHVWCRSDEYSSGFLVPFLAAYVLWSKRDDITRPRIKPAMAGALAFGAAQAFRLFGLYYMYGSAERLSIILSIAALVVLLFGWQLFRKVSPVLIFLFLMLPLPNRLQAAVALPLQHLATTSAVFCLETIGYEVLQEGNLIHIGQATIAVSEACNGLRMITAFFVISGLVVLLVKRDWWEKLIVLVSSIPVALLCNTCRLTITSLAFTVLSGEQWEKVFHDFGGYAMMPLALMIVVAELWLLARLTSLPIRKEVVM
jgi:exosortase